MAEEINKDKPANDNSLRQMVMTEDQRKAYDAFIDYMAQLYRKYSYLFDEGENQ